jgi:hypothetical protein
LLQHAAPPIVTSPHKNRFAALTSNISFLSIVLISPSISQLMDDKAPAERSGVVPFPASAAGGRTKFYVSLMCHDFCELALDRSAALLLNWKSDDFRPYLPPRAAMALAGCCCTRPSRSAATATLRKQHERKSARGSTQNALSAPVQIYVVVLTGAVRTQATL